MRTDLHPRHLTRQLQQGRTKSPKTKPVNADTSGTPAGAHLSDQRVRDTEHMDSGPKELQLAHHFEFREEKR